MSVVVIAFDGGIEDFPALIQSVDNLVEDGTRRLVVDLAALPFINSAALGYLLRTHQALETKQGRLALCGLQPALLRILEMTNLDTVFHAYETEAEAVAALGGDPRAVESDAPGVRRVDWKG
jgi:anti-anti-sigma factor